MKQKIQSKIQKKMEENPKKMDNKRKFFACMRSHHGATPGYLWDAKLWFFLFFLLWLHLTRSMWAWAGIFNFFIIIIIIDSKVRFFAIFFTLNWLFYTLISINDLDFLTVCAEVISTSNKKKLKIDAIDFFFKFLNQVLYTFYSAMLAGSHLCLIIEKTYLKKCSEYCWILWRE